ncbi:unnamed protein product [Cladocopium goreaui]|uniref:GDP-mannose transporter GONST4 n=1 Tax=Cladocopium goreaui TaxID=2562237 RepID=A0A9P1M6B5_9DINO|nr:unnamed protein product [Cladocopium goreaui]
MSKQAEQMQILAATSLYCFSSVGMLLFNKLAIQHFPLECSLVWAQLFFSAACLSLFAFPYIHVGSMKDLLRWCMVVPFYCGMLLTSILALKHAPMSLVIVLRNTSPLGTLVFERFYPEPLRISGRMLGAILMMMIGAMMYVSKLPVNSWQGIGWVLLNSAIAVADRLLQRLLLSKEQCPVDISKTGITLINNLVGLLPVGVAMYFKGEFSQLPAAVALLSPIDKAYIAVSCVIGLAISYTSIWAQSLISATSFLVMINANKFIIIGIEAFGLHSKALSAMQIAGASLTILGGVAYGKARQAIEEEAEEMKFLLPQKDGMPPLKVKGFSC